ncbi:MAG: SPFH domain-containing protein [Candidatus Dojkabacteria bacterium]
MEPFIFLSLCFGSLFLLLLAGSIKIVGQQSALVIETLGKFSGVRFAGITIVIPIIQRVRAKVFLYGQDLNFQILAITSDKVTITLDTTLVYHVKTERVAESFYALADPISVMKSTLENSIRSYVANQTHEEILQKRDELTQYLVEHLVDIFDTWGREIDAFQIQDVVLPKEITDAMSKVIASKRLQEAAEFEANANKILKVRAAEAEREASKLTGMGIAEQREAIINGLKESVENMQQVTGSSTDTVMNIVLVTQYLDMLKSIGESDNAKVIFLNSKPGNLDDVMQQIYGMMKQG